jgi:preprotein translocase subunit SecG
MIAYISRLFDKMLEASSPLTKIGREILYKNREILAFSIGIALYFHFFYRVMMEMIYNIDGILRWFERLNPIGKGCLLLPCLFILIVLIEVVIKFFTPNKKKIDTSNFINKKKFVPFLERFYSVLPYIWFLVEIVMSLYSDSLNLVRAYLPSQVAKDVIMYFLYPINQIYFSMPGLQFGILGNFLFFMEYSLIARAKNKYSYFLRYNFMQIVLLNALFGFYTNCYFLIIKYSSIELAGLIGISVLGVFICMVIYLIIIILLGKESRFPFLDEAMQYQIGRRRKK